MRQAAEVRRKATEEVALDSEEKEEEVMLIRRPRSMRLEEKNEEEVELSLPVTITVEEKKRKYFPASQPDYAAATDEEKPTASTPAKEDASASGVQMHGQTTIPSLRKL